ncbi:MAG: putative glycosyltransferase [Ilumatobacteraceae bacterium]|nr:putative glycosyltransferase [Ilumatobacteraceae bacterium]
MPMSRSSRSRGVPPGGAAAVSVNLLFCVPGKVGGSEDYLVRQMLGLAEVAARPNRAANDLVVVPTVYAPQGFAAAHPDLAEQVHVVEAPITGESRGRRVVYESTWLFEQTAGSALVHHGGGTIPLRGHRPTLLTIHDLQYLTYPEYMRPVKRLYIRQSMPRSARRADVIAVPTEFVRGTVIDAYDIDPDDVVVVPHGMESTLGVGATDEATLRSRYGLGNGPVIVLPAITHPHKGHRFVLDLLATRWRDPELRLVLIGGKGLADAEVERKIADLGLGARVVRPGRVPRADRDGLLQMATAMTFPSEYEGFGAPVIEAMTLGVPVICSDRTCLPEVAGDAAIVLPLDLDAWAGALDDAIARRAELVAAGRKRAALFSAAHSAEALLRAYALVLR